MDVGTDGQRERERGRDQEKDKCRELQGAKRAVEGDESSRAGCERERERASEQGQDGQGKRLSVQPGRKEEVEKERRSVC